MSLGGTKTQKNQIDPELRKAALDNLELARRVSQLGPMAYTGDTVAGMQPGQIAAIQSGNMGASAFGLPTMAVPTGENLNPYAAYQTALANIPAGQRAFIESLFINPQTGAAPTIDYRAAPAAAPAQTMQQSSGSNRDYTPTGSGGNANGFLNRANLPGGINTNNPDSFLNSVLGFALDKAFPQKAPTAKDRPPARPK